MKIGDRIDRRPVIGEGRSMADIPGTVVYIHPAGWYYTVEFSVQSRWGVWRYRESFCTKGPQ